MDAAFASIEEQESDEKEALKNDEMRDVSAVKEILIEERHRKVLAKKEQELNMLHKKINVYKKANANLKKELEAYSSNDTLLQVENRAREKQLLVEKLVQENRYLANLQRTQAKRIEELENLKEHFPAKHHSVMEELRICKETFRMYKEREKATEEKTAKLHQQVIDLTQKNKTLSDKIKQHENYKPANDTNSEHNGRINELELLQVRVAQLEKAKRHEKAKYDRVIKACEEQLEECKREMESFQSQLLDKEKELRLQVVELKKLKRTLRELVVDTHTNQQICTFLQGNMPQRVEERKIPMPPAQIVADKRPNRLLARASRGPEANLE
ncbi:hypothetical protein THRCLA_02222 [Thraustotheca clavata]|uniref:Uncharacterized protein n=1 Tax=Thraustotheca clavata TaxID=74557 RepID=A0A1W0A6M0_9STRA|nr:hypothetical protein THRCLA_02222 [Thraustotheca clavata]